jgi:hypothetical protein
MWGLGSFGTPISTFYHYIDGVKQPGLFLGQDGYTTWGIRRYDMDPSTSVDGLPYWGIRLLGLNSQLTWLNNTPVYPDEYRTFIKVYGS